MKYKFRFNLKTTELKLLIPHLILYIKNYNINNIKYMRFILICKDPNIDRLHYKPFSYISKRDFNDVDPCIFLHKNFNKIYDILRSSCASYTLVDLTPFYIDIVIKN
jgi:hypothetical protein